jgi:hypothetical protein
MLKLHGTFNRLAGYDFGDAEIRGHFTIEKRAFHDRKAGTSQ